MGEEKILITSNRAYLMKLDKIIVRLWLAGGILFILYGFMTAYRRAFWHASWSERENMIRPPYGLINFTTYLVIAFIVVALILTVFCLVIRKTSLTVSDKRVYGNAVFGKQVDLPLDSISAIGTGAFKQIAVATSSGKIKFFGISNRDEIRGIISKLLIERQGKKESIPEAYHVNDNTKPVEKTVAEQIKEFKDLLDGGVITQEEFDAKKKQLLGL